MQAELAHTWRIMVVEPHRLMSEGLKRVLMTQPDLMVCGQVYLSDEVLPTMQRTDPNLVMMDLTQRGTQNGIELGKIIVEAYPKVRVLILTLVDEPKFLEEARTGGLHGYLLKDVIAPDLIKCVRIVLAGGAFFDPRVGQVSL